MTIRLRRVEALFGGVTLDRVTYADLAGLIGNPDAAEDEDLDYKRAHHAADNRGKAELDKDVAAFANHVGGVLVIGMQEDGRTRRPTAVTPVEVTDAALRKITATLTRNILPIPAGVELLAKKESTDDEVGILMIVVAPSPGAPHQVLDSGEPAGYWRRHGTTAVLLKEHEIATGYRRRFDEQASRADRLDHIETEVFRAVTRPAKHPRESTLRPGPLVTVSLVPDLPGELVLDASTVARLRYQAADDQPLVGRTDAIFRHTVVGHRRVVHTSGGFGGHDEFHAQLHTDGSGTWARALDPVQAPALADGTVERGVDIETVVHTVASALRHLARHAALATGCSGTAALRVRVCAAPVLFLGQDELPPPDKRLPTEEWLHLMRLILPIRRGYEPAAPEPQWLATGESRALIEDLAGGRGPLVAATAELLADLVQNYGLVEVPHLTRDGAIRPSEWLANETASVRNWAAQESLATV